MPDMRNTEAVPKRIRPVIFVLDTSEHMEGKAIQIVNESMPEMINSLRMAISGAREDVRIGVLAFSDGAEWLSDGLERIEDFVWRDVEAGGAADMGAALEELNARMSRSCWFESCYLWLYPAICFISCGKYVEGWKAVLYRICNENRWFRDSVRYAVAAGEDADRLALAEAADHNLEAVFPENDILALVDVIKYMFRDRSDFNRAGISVFAGEKGNTEFPAEPIGDIAGEWDSEWD